MRIISLSPSNTELVFALGLGNQLVATDDSSDYPAEARSLPKIGSDLAIDIEAVVALKPDLVVASLLSPAMERNVQMLREAGLNHVAFETERFTDFLSDLWELGVACKVRERAEHLIAEYNERIKEIVERAIEPQRRRRVYFEWWPEPRFTPGQLSWVTDMIQIAGGDNIFQDIEGATRAVTDEEIVERDPELIFLCWMGEAAKKLSATTLDEVRARKDYAKTEAVKSNFLFTLPEGLFGRPGPRLIDGLDMLVDMIHSTLY
jgi:iron complex transport system substrate-binding protein